MSHVAKIEIEIKDLEALAQACKALGLELVRGQKSYKWFGRSVGDYPLPAGFTADELGKCEHAIRIPGNSDAYEVGIIARRDGRPGFTLLWDFFAGGYGLQNAIGENGNKLRQEYSAAVATRMYQKQGFRVARKVNADGRVILTASR